MQKLKGLLTHFRGCVVAFHESSQAALQDFPHRWNERMDGSCLLYFLVSHQLHPTASFCLMRAWIHSSLVVGYWWAHSKQYL